MREGLEFVYNGINSKDMGIFNVNMDSGLLSETFIADREILEVRVRGNEKPYFQGVRRSPLKFSLTFAFENHYDEQKIREVARWLNQEYYKPFFTTDNLERIFYCVLESDSELLHNGLKQGYVKLTFRCDSPYSYSPEYMSKVYDFDNTPSVVKEDTQSQFNLGEKKNVVATTTGELTLDPVKKKWSDYSATNTWSQI